MTKAAKNSVMFAAVALAISVLGALFGAYAEVAQERVFAVREGMSYEVGSKKAIGYFDKVAGKCALTLMIADAGSENADKVNSAARVKVTVDAGQVATVDSAEGETIEFLCHDKVNAMYAKVKSGSALTQ